jgi:Na+/H+-dicarboxylate symporter
MSGRLIALVAVIAAFGALSGLALHEAGYFGILEPHFKSWSEAQVLADLVILAVLSCIWMVQDARQRGLSAWPFVLITLVAGSFGVLFYLVARSLRGTRPLMERSPAR